MTVGCPIQAYYSNPPRTISACSLSMANDRTSGLHLQELCYPKAASSFLFEAYFCSKARHRVITDGQLQPLRWLSQSSFVKESHVRVIAALLPLIGDILMPRLSEGGGFMLTSPWVSIVTLPSEFPP